MNAQPSHQKKYVCVYSHMFLETKFTQPKKPAVTIYNDCVSWIFNTKT